MRLTRVIVTLLALIVAAGFYLLLRYLTDDLESQTYQATEESMVDTVHAFAGLLEVTVKDGEIDPNTLDQALARARAHEFEASIHKHKKSTIGIHAYITDAKGVVIYDSDDGKRVGLDFSKYNDIHLALNDRYAVRSSRDDEEDSTSSRLYIAVPIKENGKTIGVISLYKPQKDVLPFIIDRYKLIYLSCILIGSGVLLFTIAVFIWIFRPIGKLTHYARSITRGERQALPKLGKGREVNTLGNALHEMRESLEGRRYMENYVQMLTHELKSPLAAIRGASELLHEDMPAEQRAKFLSNIEKETARSQRIIDGLLKLSRLEAQSHLTPSDEVNISVVIEEVSQEFNERLANKELTLETTLAPNLRLKGDAMILHTAIGNLLENAIRFSPRGGTIQLTSEWDGDIAVITVKDEGPGVPDYALERVFEHFYSISAPNGTGKSSGLGLAFVKEVAKLHHGTATLENAADKGAIARLRLKAI